MTIDTTTRSWKASERPDALIREWPGIVKLTRINSKTAYFRDSGCVGELAVEVDRVIRIFEGRDASDIPFTSQRISANPNPLLLGLRRSIRGGLSADTIRFAFATCDAHPPAHISREHIEHARKVFIRCEARIA